MRLSIQFCKCRLKFGIFLPSQREGASRKSEGKSAYTVTLTEKNEALPLDGRSRAPLDARAEAWLRLSFPEYRQSAKVEVNATTNIATAGVVVTDEKRRELIARNKRLLE